MSVKLELISGVECSIWGNKNPENSRRPNTEDDFTELKIYPENRITIKFKCEKNVIVFLANKTNVFRFLPGHICKLFDPKVTPTPRMIMRAQNYIGSMRYGISENIIVSLDDFLENPPKTIDF